MITMHMTIDHIKSKSEETRKTSVHNQSGEVMFEKVL